MQSSRSPCGEAMNDDVRRAFEALDSHVGLLESENNYPNTARAMRSCIGTLRAHIETLSAQQSPPTPEEVARLEAQVREAITGNVGPEATWDAGAALSRLAAQAARVEGLVASLKASLANTEEALAERDPARKSGDEKLTLQAEQRDSALREVATLRERVAALERENREQDDARLWTESDLTTAGISVDDGLHDAVHVLIQARDTAEARVRELEELVASLESDVKAYKARTQSLEAAISAKADDYRASHGEDAEGPHPLVDWADRVLRGASHPAPTPEPLARCKDCGVVSGDGGHVVGVCDGCKLDVCGDCTDPTTPDEVRMCADCFARGAHHPAPTTGAEETETFLERMDRPAPPEVLASFAQVRRAGTPTPPTGLLEAVGRFQQWIAWTLNQYEDTAPDDVAVVTFNQRKGEALTVGDLRALRSAYDAAKGGESTTLDKARVVEVLTRHTQEPERDREHAKAREWTEWGCGYNNAIRSVARDLGLTLATPPSGPGGGERSPDANAEAWAKGVRAKEALVRAALHQHRARIAPTPTPEAQPLKPSAPGVVWEQDDVRVLADGTLEWDGEALLREWDVAKVLARALAEAKREVERLNAERQETACEAIRRFASRLGDDATGFDKVSHLEELEVALYQHVLEEQEKASAQAAESMRERAAKVADKNDMSAWGIANTIRALPLEEP